MANNSFQLRNEAGCYSTDSTKRWAVWLSVVFSFLIPMAACAQSKSITWREEVKLSNGQIIVAERTDDFKDVYAGGSGNGLLFQHGLIRATLPPLNKEVTWEGSLKPLAMDIGENGDIYLVATWQSLQGKKENSVPNGVAHVAFRFDVSGQWIRIPVATVPPEVHPNLLIDDVDLFVRHGYSTKKTLDLAYKEKLNADPAFDDRYKGWKSR